MKKYLLGAFALVLAIGFSAFTNSASKADKKQVVRYLVYNSGAQTAIGSYSQVTTPPACDGIATLCVIRIVDPNGNGIITQAEFDPKFNALDVSNNNTLNDETEGGDLFKKS